VSYRGQAAQSQRRGANARRALLAAVAPGAGGRAGGGNLAFDAQIVALCRECRVRALLTEDRDFGRFAVERLT